jgi:carbamoyl-phosphate synthase large subunit
MKKVIAITGLHRGENPQPGAAVAASLRRRFPNLRIIGLSYDPFESSLYCNDGSRPDAAYLMPYPGAGSDAILQRINEISKRERLDLIIPCLDSEIPNFIALQSKFQKCGIGVVLPTKKSLVARSKVNLHSFCKRLNIMAPRAESANDPETLAIEAESMGYPIYVKGKFYEAYLVNSKAELYDAFYKIYRVWGGPVIIQETLVGEEYDIVGLGDGKGNIISSCSIRKMMRTSAGKGFAGIVVADPALDEIGKRIIKGLRWYGPFELEFIKVPYKSHVLYEINPRFPAWVDFPSQAGCNLPARLLEDYFKIQPAPLHKCSPGQMFIRHNIDVVTDIGDIAQMAVTGECFGVQIDNKQEFEAIK